MMIDLRKILTQEEIISTARKTSMMHDLSHRLRVLILSCLIMDKIRSKGIDLGSVVYSALYHDISRKTDLDFNRHGEKSAIWVKDNLRKYHPDITERFIAP